MPPRPHLSPPARTTTQLRGAAGMRGVRSRRAGDDQPSRRSSGRGPVSRERWHSGAADAGPPLATDRVERVTVPGLLGPLPVRLLGPLRAGPQPAIVAWGAGGTRPADLVRDDPWARELADLTGAIVLLAGYRPDDPDTAASDAALVYHDLLSIRAAALGIDPARIVVTGRSHGFRVAARLTAEAERWPAIGVPRTCVAATPTHLAAGALREALGLPAPAARNHAVRPGTEVFTRDGVRLGRVRVVRARDLLVRRNLTDDELAIPVRAIARVQGAVTLSVRARELVLRDWGRGHHASGPTPDASCN